MGDYTERSSPAELDDNAALSANFILPKHTVGELPPTDGARHMSAVDEMQQMMADAEEAQAEQRQTREKTGGRQKGTPNKVARFDLGKAAKLYGLRALATCVEIMEGAPDVNGKNTATNAERLSAAKEIMDRGFGKAKTITEISGIDGEDIQTRLTIEFVGQPPISATVQSKLTDEAGKTIDMELQTVRVPEQRRPWDPQ